VPERISHHGVDSPTAVVAVVVLFAYNGLIFGTYAAAISTLKQRLGLSPIQLAALFIVTGIAAVSAMQVSGRLADRFGARRLCLIGLLPLMAAGVGYGLAPSYGWLIATGISLGLGNGGIDVAMNALAVQVEAARLATGRRPIMSFFHGTWAVGTFAGALAIAFVGSVIGLAPDRAVTSCALTAAGLGVAVVVVAFLVTPETAPVAHVTASGQTVPLPKAAYLLGGLAIASGLAEGTASDWSGNQVQTVTGLPSTTAAWAVTALMACMVIIRLTGDRLVSAWGRRRLVQVGALCAAIGFLTASLTASFPLLIVGWSLVGLGAGVIAPQIYATAGHFGGGRGLAVVVTFGYATSLAGPALIGGLVHAIGIGPTMAVPAVLLLIGLPVARLALPDRSAPQ